jgi:hypothetical protein
MGCRKEMLELKATNKGKWQVPPLSPPRSCGTAVGHAHGRLQKIMDEGQGDNLTKCIFHAIKQ